MYFPIRASRSLLPDPIPASTVMTPPDVHPAFESWAIRKPAVRAAGGVVASQHHLASRIGAGVLERAATRSTRR